MASRGKKKLIKPKKKATAEKKQKGIKEVKRIIKQVKPVKKIKMKKPAKPARAKKQVKLVKKTAKKPVAVKSKKKLIKPKKKIAVGPAKNTPQKPVIKQKKIVKKISGPIEKIVNNIGIEGIEPYIPKAKEGYMSAGMRNHFRKILQAWKEQLMQEADRTLQHMQDESTNFPDPSDRATQEEEFSLELRARDRERKLIKKIEEALFSLEEGGYGYCEACGEEIGLRRLEARPTAALCIDCKTLDEIREKQQGS